jgi:CHAT domain-containing protein/Flp pilus assembly protein TadD
MSKAGKPAAKGNETQSPLIFRLTVKLLPKMKRLIPIMLLLITSCTPFPKITVDIQQQADQLLEQVSAFHEDEKIVEAIALLLENKDLFIKAGQTYYARALFLIGYLYSNLGDYVQAEFCYLEEIAIEEELYGKEHPYYATTLFILGNLYLTLEEYAKAEPYLLDVKAIREKLYGREHPDYAVSLKSLSFLYLNLEDYAKVEYYLLEIKTYFEAVYGKEHPDYADSLLNLGSFYCDLEEYSKAESCYLEVKVIYETLYGREHLDYVYILDILGNLYYNLSYYIKAESYYLELQAVSEQVYGKEHPDYALILSNLGNLYLALGNYAKAESYYLEAKVIYEAIYGRKHPDYADSLLNLGGLYYYLASFTKAELYYMEAKAVYEAVYGKKHPSYGSALHNLGVLYQELRDNAKAESCLLEAKAIDEAVYGREHPNYATVLTNLANLYQDIGDYAKAETYYLEAKSIRETVYGREHPDYAVSLTGLGILYLTLRDYDKAELYYLDAKAVREKVYGRDHPDYAGSLNNLAVLYSELGDNAKAEPYYLESKIIYEQVYGKEHPYYAISLYGLGSIYSDLGDYAKAETYYLEAKAILEVLYNKENNIYALSLGKLSEMYQDMGDYSQAETYNKELCELNINIITRNFSFMSEQQRSLYIKTVSRSFESSYNLSLQYPVETINSLNYTNTLFTKGLLLRTTNIVRDAIYSSGDTVLIEQFEQLGRLRQQINQLQQKEDANEAYLRSLEEQVDTLDKALTQASSAFRDLKADITMQWQDVRNHLQPGEAAVEFVSFQEYDKKWTDLVQYAALIVKPDSTAPVWVPLFEEGQLQAIFSEIKGKSPSEQVRILYNIYGDDLYNIIWKPLEQELTGVKTVYYSPSGLLHKIAFNALPTDESDYEYLIDKYDLNLLSSTREVAYLSRNQTETDQISTAVLYGGLNYDADEETMRAAAQSYKKDNDKTFAVSNLPEWLVKDWKWIALEESLPEVLNIQGYLEKKQIRTILYQGGLGNEESFKELDGKKTGLIHLATHGHFEDDVKRRHEEREQTHTRIMAEENPLLRSLLVLAGGNHAWTNNPVEGVESGILTADKIAGMNLLGTKLVVLSACQTGLGDVNGEGVFGLQRAFKLAGVETLIMSLWEVNDEATAMLMSVFYQEWLFSGKSRQEAFKEAQRQVSSEYYSPFFWAAFVMMD